jgi:folate-binding protein YgfZ
VLHSPLLDLHRSRGALLTEAAAGEVLLTYGDVPGEYRAALEGAALFDETARCLIQVRGADAQSFLHRILANEVRGLAVGEGNHNLLLTPKGKILEEFDLTRVAAEEFVLSTPPGRGSTLAGHLDRYLFADRVELSDRSAEYAPLALLGPRSREVLASVLGKAPDPTPRRRSLFDRDRETLAVEPVPSAGSAGWLLQATAATVSRLWDELIAGGARPAGLVVFDMLRVEAGRGRFGIDFGEEIYPQEAQLHDAFSLSKGCYVGQEIVAKIDTYGGLNKRLVGLRVDHDEPVPAGTRLFLREDDEWRDLGVVTSWAYSFALETGMLLAYVKRKRQVPGTCFRLGEGPATATVLAMPVRAGALALPELEA